MSQLFADILLLLVALVWGSTFVIVKTAISETGPFSFIAVRFLIAGSLLLIWYGVKPGKPEIRHDRRFYTGGLLTGLVLCAAYSAQTVGLMSVSAGKAAFITGLSVVLVPVGARVFFNVKTDLYAFLSRPAALGLGLMSLRLPFLMETGDLLVLICAFCFAFHILFVAAYAPLGDPVLFTAIQLLTVSLGAFIGVLFFEKKLVIPASAWPSILFTSLAATIFAFLTQSTVQRYTSPTHTALIFSSEPVFGAIFAWLLAGEMLSTKEAVGAAAIVIGMLVSETRNVRLSRDKTQ